MFQNILIPVSSEFYTKEVLERSIFLAQKFHSKINLLYIIEEKTLSQADKLSDAFRTHYDIKETKKDMIREYIRTADKIIFEDAKLFFKDKGIPLEGEIVKGEFSKVVKSEITNKSYDLILMGFEKECMLHYRLLDEVTIPIWIESGVENTSILAVCSNLAPNKKVPDLSIKLAALFGWSLKMLYIVDMEDSVEVDETGSRSDKKSEEDLISNGEVFIKQMQDKEIDITLVRGSLEKETFKAADTLSPGLVIVGREQKKRSFIGFPVKSIKKKIVEKCKYSILFVH